MTIMKKFFLWLMKVFLLTAMTWGAGYMIVIFLLSIGNTYSLSGTIFTWSLPLFILAVILLIMGRLSYAGVMTKDEYKAASIPKKIGLYLCLLIPVAAAIPVLMSMM